MKKLTALFLGLVFASGCLGCSSQQAETGKTDEVQKESSAAGENSGTQKEGSSQVQDGDAAGSGENSAEAEGGKEESAYEFSRYAKTVPIVYMSSEITPRALLKLYKSFDREVEGNNTAVQISFIETQSGSGLQLELVRDLVQFVDGTITGCSSTDSRFGTGMDRYQQTGRGFAEIAKIDIMDAEGSITIPVAGGRHLSKNYVGSHFTDYDGFLVLSHFRRHEIAGFGGAVSNLSVGISSAEGKCMIYTAGRSRTSLEGSDQDSFLESMAEAGKSVVDALEGNILYVNIMNALSLGCDCDGTQSGSDVHDIGIFASDDPVALDQACVDYVYMAQDSGDFVEQIEEMNAEYVLEYGEEIGLGDCAYTIISIDD